MSLGEDTARLNPKLSTSPIARNTNQVSQTKPIIRIEMQRYLIMHKRDQRNSNTFMDIEKDRSDKKLKVHRSQQTHRKRVTSYGSPRDHCIENSERERERYEAI